MGSGKLKNYLDLGFKIFLILFGLAEFTPWYPNSWDIADKILTSLILVYFWFRLKPFKFMFGRKSRFFDIAVITSYYVLFINTFLRFLPDISQQTVSLVNKISIYAGTGSIIAIALLITIFVKVREKSVIHSFTSIFSKKRLFEKLNQKFFFILKFLFSFIILYSIGVYFFGLITQWFVVSLDKSLLILAIIYGIKDLEHSKIKALHSVGNFDDKLLETITDLFTSPKKIYLGFGFLLIFHYLSDIGTFFLSYLTNFIQLDTAYYALGSETHHTLYYLFTQETARNFFTSWTYIFSGLGILALLLIPILLCFSVVFKIDLKKLIEKKLYIILLLIISVSSIIYFLSQWTKQVPIIGSEYGIIGVDFITQKISEISIFSFTTLFFISLALIILGLFALNKKVSKYLTLTIYLVSLVFLGNYVWNYFISSLDYYSSLISAFKSTFFLSFNFSLLLFFDFIFYIGAFILFSYHSLKYIISHVKDLVTNKSITTWTLLLIIIPAFVMFNLTIKTITLATIIISVLFMFTLGLYKELTGKEYRDDYILGVNIVIASYQILLLVIVFMTIIFNISAEILNFIQPIVILVLSFLFLRFFNIKPLFKNIRLKGLFFSIMTGITFGLFFYLINEPKTPIFNNSFLYLALFTLLIAFSEELLFRSMLFRLAQKAFSFTGAILLQALVFAGTHFLNLKELFEHYSLKKSLYISNPILLMSIYFTGLFLFAIVTARFVGKAKGKKANGSLTYAIIIHLIANFIRLLL